MRGLPARPETSARIARVIFNELAARGVDLIVAETGDGIMGRIRRPNDTRRSGTEGLGRGLRFVPNDPVGVRAAWRISHCLRSRRGCS